MPDSQSIENDFISKITSIIEENLSNDQFGVSELAAKVGMSRSNLLRKVKNHTKLSASQFIRNVRLKNAMEILRQSSSNISEVSYQVGFGSPSYFIKCFHDYFGYPPGEVGKREESVEESGEEGMTDRKKTIGILLVVLSFCALVTVLLVIIKPFSRYEKVDKSIAVLPFKNDSNDSTNIYVVNGLMESILSNLQMIEDLRVVSRTSVEQYRNNPKSIKEIAKELDVKYIIEGSGQKNGKQIFLNIQLIEAKSDRHLLSEQYRREDKDVFDLQADVAKNIAKKIEAVITPDEKNRIEKIPTESMEGYDLFLKGRDKMFSSSREDLAEAVTQFKGALLKDNNFALAYADLSITYSILDFYQAEKQYIDSAIYYADNALRIDPLLPQSLVSKALSFMNSANYGEALPYLEKALEYNPNSAFVINLLSDYYTSFEPNAEKYLEYALKGIELDIASNDSAETSVIYLHLSNAFIQSGFVEEAEHYINKSLDYDPDNIYSEYVRSFILYARDGDLSSTKERLKATFAKDTTRLDVLQEIAKICYYMRDYNVAYKYYNPFNQVRDALNLDIYKSENGKIAVVLDMVGRSSESERYFSEYKSYAEADKSIYRNLSLAMYYAYMGDSQKALEHMKLFAMEDNYHYWTVLFLKIDPLIDKLKDNQEFMRLLDGIEKKFWEYHNELKTSLEKKELI